MGCWQETCALTLTPINPRERCVVVVMNRHFTERYWKSNRKNRYGISLHEDPDSCTFVEAIYRGTYNNYGWIKEIEDTEAPEPQQGAKDGATDYVDRPLSQRHITIFFHEKVWDKAVEAGMPAAKKWEQHRLDEISNMEEIRRERAEERGEPYKPSIFAKAPPTKEAVELQAVAEVGYWTRRDLWASDAFHGAQAWENHHYYLLHDLTNEILNKMRGESGHGSS